VEAAFGVLSQSVALLADAGHNLSDVLGLVVAWAAAELSKRAPSRRFTYGLRGSSILAALFNAVFLLVVVGAIGWEAVHRLLNPAPVASGTVMAVAAAGIVVNGVTAWLFAAGRKGDLNIRGAFLHMFADAVVSAGVVGAGALIWLTGWAWLDPLMSLVIVAVITVGTWRLLREGVALSLGAVPEGIDAGAVEAFLREQPGVAGLHDLHIWPLGTRDVALTAHLVTPAGHPGDAALLGMTAALEARFGIGHVTLQVETGSATCPLAPAGVM
jgi:cobalt-zinc-cadmium efflux system protein